MEENKVATRDKLAALLKRHAVGDSWNYYIVADAILQSPDLRVTLAEPRFRVTAVERGIWQDHYEVSDRKDAFWIAHFRKESRANEYVDWLNSKEPK